MIIQESPIHKLALASNINVFTPTNLNEENIKKILTNLQPDLIIVMGYGIKLPKFILQLPMLGCINIHVSLLPRWRGAAPIEHALLSGDKKTGISIFKLNEEMDAGPIAISQSVKIDDSIDKKDLTKKLNHKGIQLLHLVLPDILNKKIKYKIQDINKVTYANKISTEMRKLDFNENIDIIHNKIRAFSPKPCAWFIYKNERIKIIKSEFVKGSWNTGIIINNQFHIGCKGGKICPIIIQREGKKSMELNDFLRGFSFKTGTKLNV